MPNTKKGMSTASYPTITVRKGGEKNKNYQINKYCRKAEFVISVHNNIILFFFSFENTRGCPLFTVPIIA